MELSNLKVSLNCANRSRANAKINADRAESKLESSERVTSDLFEENKEVKQQLEEVTSKAESLQSELLESNKTNILLKKKLDEYDLASKRFQESLKKDCPDQRANRNRETGQTITSNESGDRNSTS